jgi:hypothetical protein
MNDSAQVVRPDLEESLRKQALFLDPMQTLAVLRQAQAALRAPGAMGEDGLAHLVGGSLTYADMAIAVAVGVSY